MPTTIAAQPTDVALFIQASLAALIRTEVAGRVPPRFTGAGPDVWATFRNELTAADLATLVIQDAGVSMPAPFAPEVWWPGWPEWGVLRQPAGEVQAWMADALATAEQPRDAYLRGQAGLLGIELPPDEALAALPLPARHERWLELPPTAGWVAYTLSVRPGAELYFWDNFTIICTAPAEMFFAMRRRARANSERPTAARSLWRTGRSSWQAGSAPRRPARSRKPATTSPRT